MCTINPGDSFKRFSFAESVNIAMGKELDKCRKQRVPSISNSSAKLYSYVYNP